MYLTVILTPAEEEVPIFLISTNTSSFNIPCSIFDIFNSLRHPCILQSFLNWATTRCSSFNIPCSIFNIYFTTKALRARNEMPILKFDFSNTVNQQIPLFLILPNASSFNVLCSIFDIFIFLSHDSCGHES